MENFEIGGAVPPQEKKTGYTVGVQKNPDGTWDYSKAMDMKKSTFFGSEKAFTVNEVSKKMSQDGDTLSGAILSDMINFAIEKPEMDREELGKSILASYNFDGMTGESLSQDVKNVALGKALVYFDELQELRDLAVEQEKIIQAERENGGGI